LNDANRGTNGKLGMRGTMTEPAGEATERLDPARIQSVRRRLGFVAVLWWIAAVAGSLGVARGMSAGWARLTFLGISWVLAIIFSFAWWTLHKETQSR
jgi:hypothetical protein